MTLNTVARRTAALMLGFLLVIFITLVMVALFISSSPAYRVQCFDSNGTSTITLVYRGEIGMEPSGVYTRDGQFRYWPAMGELCMVEPVPVSGSAMPVPTPVPPATSTPSAPKVPELEANSQEKGSHATS